MINYRTFHRTIYFFFPLPYIFPRHTYIIYKINSPCTRKKKEASANSIEQHTIARSPISQHTVRIYIYRGSLPRAEKKLGYPKEIADRARGATLRADKSLRAVSYTGFTRARERASLFMGVAAARLRRSYIGTRDECNEEAREKLIGNAQV